MVSIILAVFALGMVSMGAVAHGPSPQAGQVAMMAGADHMQDAAADCTASADCAANETVCAWACAGLTAMAPGAPPIARPRPAGRARFLSAARMRTGIAPALDKPPPKAPRV